MTQELSGKIAVVTGASRGIGRGIAKELATRGAFVIGFYAADHEKAGSAVREIKEVGGDAEFYQCDVRDRKVLDEVLKDITGKHGQADILVNNAGVHQHLKSWELSVEDWKEVIDINLTGMFMVSKAFIPGMMERKSGKILNISSCVAYTGTDHEVHYAASKGGVVSLTKSLALELAPHNINVNAIAPGYIDTDMVVFDSPEQKKDVLETIPKGRLGQPSDIARAVSFLCSDDADYITGEILHVNGGLLMA